MCFRESANPNWVEELKEDVIEECTRHGGIVHIYVDHFSKDGNVYVKCPSISVAMSVIAALNGRYFGGNFNKAQFLNKSFYLFFVDFH